MIQQSLFIKSQSNFGWKGLLGVIQFKLWHKTCTVRWSYLGLCPAEFLISLRIEIPPLWAPVSVSSQNFLHCHFCLLSLFLSLHTSKSLQLKTAIKILPFPSFLTAQQRCCSKSLYILLALQCTVSSMLKNLLTQERYQEDCLNSFDLHTRSQYFACCCDI